MSLLLVWQRGRNYYLEWKPTEPGQREEWATATAYIHEERPADTNVPSTKHVKSADWKFTFQPVRGFTNYIVAES